MFPPTLKQGFDSSDVHQTNAHVAADMGSTNSCLAKRFYQ